MPNWCQNKVVFTFPDRDAYNKFSTALTDGCLFSTFVPLELENGELEDKMEFSRTIELWGTKWEPSEIKIEDVPVTMDNNDPEIEAVFETVWAPPLGFFERLNLNYGIFVSAMFYEPGEQIFGKCIYKNATEKNKYYNYPNSFKQLDSLRKTIGINGDLDVYMNAEWKKLEDKWERGSDDSF